MGNLSINELIKRGLSSLDHSSRDAMKYFKKALKIDPKNFMAHYGLGQACSRMERYEEALASFKEAVRIRPDYAEAHSYLTFAYAQLGRYEEALACLREANHIRLGDTDEWCGPGHPSTFNHANPWHYQEAVNLLINPLIETIRTNPDSAEAHFNLGYACLELGCDWPPLFPERFFREAIRINPDYLKAHYYLGLSRIKPWPHSDWEGASASFKEVIRISPDHAEAHWYLGICDKMMADMEMALKEYKILKGLDLALANKLFNLIYK